MLLASKEQGCYSVSDSSESGNSCRCLLFQGPCWVPQEDGGFKDDLLLHHCLAYETGLRIPDSIIVFRRLVTWYLQCKGIWRGLIFIASMSMILVLLIVSLKMSENFITRASRSLSRFGSKCKSFSGSCFTVLDLGSSFSSSLSSFSVS